MIVNAFSHVLQPMLDPVIHKMIKYVQNVEEKDLKDKVIFNILSIQEELTVCLGNVGNVNQNNSFIFTGKNIACYEF